MEIEKEIVREVARVINLTWENLQIAKHKSGKAFVQFSGLICALRSVDFLRFVFCFVLFIGNPTGRLPTYRESRLQRSYSERQKKKNFTN